MKQLTLFLLLTLFIISCGDDDTPVTPEKPQSQSLLPLADGNKWYMDVSRRSEYDTVDITFKYYITFEYKGEYSYEANPVKLYTMSYVSVDGLFEPDVRDHFFEYQNYVYSIYNDAIEDQNITQAGQIFIKNIEKEGVINIDSRKYNVQKSTYELDGKSHFAWELRRISDDSGDTFIEKYIPGIGIAYRFIEDKEYGIIREEKLYKYELN